MLMIRSRSWEISAWLLVRSCHIADDYRLEDEVSRGGREGGDISRRCTYLEAKGLSVSSSSGHFDLYLHDQLSSMDLVGNSQFGVQVNRWVSLIHD